MSLDVKAGLPQGSILGPFLFSVFINDFQCNVRLLSVLYAHDTTLLQSGGCIDSVKHDLNRSLELAKAWYALYNFAINNEKQKAFVFQC